MENSLDPVHLEWLHLYFSNYVLERLGKKDPDARSFWRAGANWRRHEKIGFDVFEHGIVKRRVFEGDDEENAFWKVGHCVVFPFMLQFSQIRIPVDDSHTLYWWYNVYDTVPGEPEQRVADIPVYKVPVPGVDAEGLPIWELADNNSGQDNFAWSSQGPVTPRWTEHLGESDKGLILYRRLLREQMKIVEDGGDPMNTFRDPAKNVSIHVPTESDDPNWGGYGSNQTNRTGASVGTGQSTKYSPIAQARARRAGFAVPEAVNEAVQRVAAFGQIHPRG
jgi:5,5'-dehydrodivanillate O-demethylase